MSPFKMSVVAVVFGFAAAGHGLANEPKADPSADKLLQGWPGETAKAARAVIDKYGRPDETTPSKLIWHARGPWMMTVAYREPVAHDFPMPHQDSVEQFVAYKVPVDKFDDLAEYDGSVIAERTKGVLSARCDKEAANFLAINLADDIVMGKKTVAQARDAYAKAIQAMMRGEKPAIMQRLQFEAKSIKDTADRDRPAMR